MNFKDSFMSVKDWIYGRGIKFWFILYVIVALFTFGFASAKHRNDNATIEAFLDAQCSTAEDRVTAGSVCYTKHKDYNPDMIVGIFSGFFWPLYWTQQTFYVLISGPQLPTVITKTVVQKEYITLDDANSSSDEDTN